MLELVVIQSGTFTVDAPEFRHKVESVAAEILSLGSGLVAAGRNYYQTNDETLVARDRSTTIVQLVLAGDFDEATANVARVLDIIAKADEEDDFRVLMSGAASIAFETNELSRHDLEQGERFGLPVALIILLVLFGSIVAALLPIGLAIVAIIVALGLVAADRSGISVGVLRDHDGEHDRNGGRDRLFAPHSIAIPRGDEPRSGQARCGDPSWRNGGRDGAVQRCDHGRLPVRDVDRAGDVLPLACHRRHSGRDGRTGGRP